jgi:hypothetical protein
MGTRRAVALTCLASLLAAGSAAATPVDVEVQAEPGRTGEALRELREAGAEVTRRRGGAIQVAADPARIGALAALPGVASAGPAPTSFGDGIITEGLQRQGGAPFERLAGGGTGLIIAILDLGFGTSIARLQAAGELPPDSRLVSVSFDTTNGLAGRNAYGNATNHGELVAQTVYDYAPKARYVFVNYRTRLDFVKAVDWLVGVRPNIIVHSNSFLEGPFDGSGPEAQAIDRVAAAGSLWFNSAGNYAQRHWEGPWADSDGDGALDLGADGQWTFERELAQPISFAVSWYSPPDGTPDLSLQLQRQEADGAWTTVAASDDDQGAGARLSERIVGYRDGRGGTFRVRIQRSAGPAPELVTIFAREIDLADAGGDQSSSQPSPGDARGAISVGAVDWRGDVRKRYSSVGPTDDGRAKPDIVAPTNTSILGKAGRRRVGGTSNSAPNAAGAAALLMGSLRRTGADFSANAVRAHLFGRPLDLGPVGRDPLFGAGRVKIEHQPPRLIPRRPRPLRRVRGRVRLDVLPRDASRLARWQLFVGDSPATPVRVTERIAPGIDTRRLADGWHALRVEAVDWPGNVSSREWWVQVDNTRPELRLRSIRIGPRPRRVLRAGPSPELRAARVRRAMRPVTAVISAGDNLSGALTVGIRVTDRRGGPVVSRRASVAPGPRRAVAIGRLRRGRYIVRLIVRDVAGNRTAVERRILVR